MPCSFRDALGQTGFCCGGSGTGLQRAVVCKSNSCDLPAIDLQQSSASKQYQIFWSPLRHNFSEVTSKDRPYCHRWLQSPKACSNSKQASKQLPGREITDVCCFRSCIPNVLCKNSRNVATVTGRPSAPASQRDAGDLVSFLVFHLTNDFAGSWGSPKAEVPVL